MTSRTLALVAICGMISVCSSGGCKSAGKSGVAAQAPMATYVPPAPTTYRPQTAPPAYDAVAEPSQYRGSGVGTPRMPSAANRPAAASCPNCASGNCSM